MVFSPNLDKKSWYKHIFIPAQLKFDFEADKLLMNFKLFSNFVQSKQCTISTPTFYKMCANITTQTKTLLFALLELLLYMKPVYCTSEPKTSLVKNERNVHGQTVTVHMYTKPVKVYTKLNN